jgi:NADH-quinone oxidoreductase subunit N
MSAINLTAILPLLIVISWAILLLIVDLFVPRDRKTITAGLAALGLVAALVVVLLQNGEDARQAFNGMIVADGFSSFLQILFILLGLFAIALANDYLKRVQIERGEYYTLMLFSISGMMLMAQAGDLIVIFLALELLSIPLYVLAGFARPNSDSEESAMKYFLLGAFASGFVVYGVAMVYGATASTGLGAIISATLSGTANEPLLLLGSGLILVGLGFKVAAVPFHMWTPDVYQGAPSSVTAFMSVGAKAGGFAALLRVFMTAFPVLNPSWVPIVVGISAVTMTWGNIAAIGQSSIKRMLAYSSIAHAGYILMALPAAAAAGVTQSAISAALFYLMTYAIGNLGAWGIVVAMEKAEGRGLSLEDYAGLGTRHPAIALAMAIFMLSLLGMPLTAGFIGKFFIFRAVLDAGFIWLAIVGAVTSVISAYYYLRVVVIMYMKPGEPETRSELWLETAVLVAALGTFLIGILPGPLLELASKASLAAFVP